MTQVQSGWFQTSNRTPTGQSKKIAVDNPYITKDDFVSSVEALGLGITNTHVLYTSGELDRLILIASGMINKHCMRYFDTQTIDETRTRFYVKPYNPELVTVVLKNRPFWKVNSIYIQVLQWFIQVDVSTSGYLQEFSDYGYYKIVPLLSSAGTGANSPIPAAILDRQPLGVLWTNYTFGYGVPQTSITLTADATKKIYTAPVGYRLWAPDQTTTIYSNGVAVTPASIDYANGVVTFTNSQTTNVITADFISNESIPADIKEACKLLVSYLIGQALQNPAGASSYSIQTFSISFSGDNQVLKRAHDILESYVNNIPQVI